MHHRGGVLLAGLLGCAAPAYGQSHDHGPASFYGSPDEEISSLARNLDSAIKLCSEESARTAAGVSEPGKVEKQAVTAGMLQWVEDPPPALKAITTRDGRSARTGKWFDPHATIWVLADNKSPTCRLLVGGSYWTPQVRPALYAKVQDDHYWQIQGPEQPFQKDYVRAEFRAAPLPDGKAQPAILITAPAQPVDGGTQLTVSIGFTSVSKEEK